MKPCLRKSGMSRPIFHAREPCISPSNINPPLGDMSGALKSTRIFLPETVPGKEKSIFSWNFGLLELSLHIRSVYKYLVFSTMKVLIFVETTKLNASFLCPYELFRLSCFPVGTARESANRTHPLLENNINTKSET